jgi:hypothetical protein
MLEFVGKQMLPAPAARLGLPVDGPYRGCLVGVNPRLLPVGAEAPLAPAQRAALLPHWHSFLDESLRLRQELRATLAAISSNPAALGLSLGGAGSSQVSAAQLKPRAPRRVTGGPDTSPQPRASLPPSPAAPPLLPQADPAAGAALDGHYHAKLRLQAQLASSSSYVRHPSRLPPGRELPCRPPARLTSSRLTSPARARLPAPPRPPPRS